MSVVLAVEMYESQKKYMSVCFNNYECQSYKIERNEDFKKILTCQKKSLEKCENQFSAILKNKLLKIINVRRKSECLFEKLLGYLLVMLISMTAKCH